MVPCRRERIDYTANLRTLQSKPNYTIATSSALSFGINQPAQSVSSMLPPQTNLTEQIKAVDLPNVTGVVQRVIPDLTARNISWSNTRSIHHPFHRKFLSLATLSGTKNRLVHICVSSVRSVVSQTDGPRATLRMAILEGSNHKIAIPIRIQ